MSALVLLFSYVPGCFSVGSSEVEHAHVGFDISPDGEQVAFASAEGDLFVLELDAGKVSQLTKTKNIELSPAYSPDGKSIVYTAAGEDRQGFHIFRILLNGMHHEQLTNEAGVSDAIPKCSSDGSRIAFARAHRHRPYSLGGWTWDNVDVYIMNVDGSNVTRLTHNSYYSIGGVEFSRDGNSVLFTADNNRAASDLSTNVFQVSINGSDSPTAGVPQPTVPGKYAAWASEADCSSDGKNVVVISDRASSFHYDLVLIDTVSGDAKALGATSISQYNQNPVFAPDGKQIFFLAGTAWNASSRPIFSLWSIGIDGKYAREIAGSQLFTDPMKWAPQK